MIRTLGALVLLLIATATSGLAAQKPQVSSGPAAPAAARPPEALDLSGSWIGMIIVPDKEKGKRTPSSLHVVLKQSDLTLTGTAGSNSKDQTTFTNGRVETTKFGTTLSFNLPGPDFVMEFQLRPAEGMLRGLARLSGVNPTAAVELHRVDANVRAKASNVTGTWIGTFGLAKTEHLLHVVLDQSGAAVTGTVGPHAYNQVAITNGKVVTTDAGTSVSFQMDQSADAVVMLFALTLTETGLKGTITASHSGEQVSGPVELKPVK